METASNFAKHPTDRGAAMNISKAADTQDLLGESPIWCERDQVLYWVDVRGPGLRRLDPATGKIDVWALPELVGSLAVREQGGLLLAMQSGLAFFDLRNGKLDFILSPEAPEGKFRLNDGKCDRQGRFWVGSKHDASNTAIGSLFRFNPDRSCTVMDRHIAMPNSLAWSPDNTVMYFADSGLKTIFSYPFNAVSGTIGPRKVFAECECLPDGATVDRDGYLWSAGYDGWRLTRYAPDGRVDRVVNLPIQRPTSCAFGGPGLATLYVTTARQRLSEQELGQQPMAGCLLALDVGISGLPEARFQG